ncbi:MAG: HU family DNA-binding protein [Alistipes sp.]|nr:HU family DNA-binding protein [Alistipes sp.]
MNKAQLIEAVALEANISKVAAKRAVDAVVGTTIQALLEGDKLSLPGLGTFSVALRPARTGRNPRTGAAVKVPAKRVVKFRPTLELE